MIEIDGSFGEGGGQILRTAIALSAIIKEDVLIKNIRQNRPQKGLKAQHLKSIEAVANMCDADTKGMFQGSEEIYFSPSDTRGFEDNISIGTAGSIPLIMQSIMPVASFCSEKTRLLITGGTDISWSPSIDYIKEVTLNALKKMGYRADITLIERGYYPKGCGIAEIVIIPSRIKGFAFKACEKDIKGISHCSNLPEHVARRQAGSAKNVVAKNTIEADIDIDIKNVLSTGSGITLWSGLIGSVGIGSKGLAAEKVGSLAAHILLDDKLSGAAVDIHLSDQLIPYMGLAGKGSFTTRELTSHCLTNIHITERMLDMRFSIDKVNDLVEISVE